MSETESEMVPDSNQDAGPPPKPPVEELAKKYNTFCQEYYAKIDKVGDTYLPKLTEIAEFVKTHYSEDDYKRFLVLTNDSNLHLKLRNAKSPRLKELRALGKLPSSETTQKQLDLMPDLVYQWLIDTDKDTDRITEETAISDAIRFHYTTVETDKEFCQWCLTNEHITEQQAQRAGKRQEIAWSLLARKHGQYQGPVIGLTPEATEQLDNIAYSHWGRDFNKLDDEKQKETCRQELYADLEAKLAAQEAVRKHDAEVAEEVRKADQKKSEERSQKSQRTRMANKTQKEADEAKKFAAEWKGKPSVLGFVVDVRMTGNSTIHADDEDKADVFHKQLSTDMKAWLNEYVAANTPVGIAGKFDVKCEVKTADYGVKIIPDSAAGKPVQSETAKTDTKTKTA